MKQDWLYSRVKTWPHPGHSTALNLGSEGYGRWHGMFRSKAQSKASSEPSFEPGHFKVCSCISNYCVVSNWSILTYSACLWEGGFSSNCGHSSHTDIWQPAVLTPRVRGYTTSAHTCTMALWAHWAWKLSDIQTLCILNQMLILCLGVAALWAQIYLEILSIYGFFFFCFVLFFNQTLTYKLVGEVILFSCACENPFPFLGPNCAVLYSGPSHLTSLLTYPLGPGLAESKVVLPQPQSLPLLPSVCAPPPQHLMVSGNAAAHTSHPPSNSAALAILHLWATRRWFPSA